MAAEGAEREELVLQSIFLNFGHFGFDKAKEMCDKEKVRSAGIPLWTLLLSHIGKLALAEKNYMNLTFLLTKKSFLWRESPVYEHLLSDLNDMNERCTSVPLTSPANAAELFTCHIASQLSSYVQARVDMMSLYEMLLAFSHEKNFCCDDLTTSLSNIILSYDESFHHQVLSPLRNNFKFECEILNHLLNALKDMQEWRFLPSLLNLHDAHAKINSWDLSTQAKETKKYSFGVTFLKSASLPLLYQWLCTAKCVFLSKFSIYFYVALSGQTSSLEIKSLMAKQKADYVAKIHTFQKKTDASNIALILDTEGLLDYKGHGYHHPLERPVYLSGLKKYRVIFSFPQESINERFHAVAVQLSEFSRDDMFMDRIDYLYDKAIDARITLAVMYDCRRQEKDSATQDFIQDLTTSLKCKKVFSLLKPK